MNKYKLNSKFYVGELEEFNFHYKSVRKLLILTSKSVHKIHNVISFINKISNNIKISIEYINAEAPVQNIDNIILKNNKPDLIVAIGGGSVLDSAKAISLGWQNGLIYEYLYNKIPIPNSKIKLIAVPTTAGTGSEMSFGAILSDKKNNFKGGIRTSFIQPDTVIIDKNLYQNASKKIKSESGFDCLAHAIETYISTKSSTFIKMQSVNCISQIFNSLERAVNGDSFSMELIAISSSLMGINLAYSSTCLPHRMQYILGPFTNTRHSEGIIYLYKGWLPQIKSYTEFEKLANTLGFSSDQLVDKINELKNNLNINYSLSDIGVNEKMIDDMSWKSSSLDFYFINIYSN